MREIGYLGLPGSSLSQPFVRLSITAVIAISRVRLQHLSCNRKQNMAQQALNHQAAVQPVIDLDDDDDGPAAQTATEITT